MNNVAVTMKRKPVRFNLTSKFQFTCFVLTKSEHVTWQIKNVILFTTAKRMITPSK